MAAAVSMVVVGTFMAAAGMVVEAGMVAAGMAEVGIGAGMAVIGLCTIAAISAATTHPTIPLIITGAAASYGPITVHAASAITVTGIIGTIGELSIPS
jgi:hypothetical protein